MDGKGKRCLVCYQPERSSDHFMPEVSIPHTNPYGHSSLSPSPLPSNLTLAAFPNSEKASYKTSLLPPNISMSGTGDDRYVFTGLDTGAVL